MGARPKGSIAARRPASRSPLTSLLRGKMGSRLRHLLLAIWLRLRHWLDRQNDNQWRPVRYRSRLKLTTDLQELPDLLQWFDRRLQQVIPERLPPQFLWECQLILTEGFTNAARHAHRHRPPQTPIVVEVGRSGRCLVIEIWDCGDPFDWDAKLAALRQEHRNPLEKESGRGLMFMEQLSQRVRYRRYGGRNCLMVRKAFPA